MKSEPKIKMEQSLITAIIHMASESLAPDKFEALVDILNVLAETRGLGSADIEDTP